MSAMGCSGSTVTMVGSGPLFNCAEWSTVDPEIFALNILRLLIFRVVLFSSLEHTDEN